MRNVSNLSFPETTGFKFIDCGQGSEGRGCAAVPQRAEPNSTATCPIARSPTRTNLAGAGTLRPGKTLLEFSRRFDGARFQCVRFQVIIIVPFESPGLMDRLWLVTLLMVCLAVAGGAPTTELFHPPVDAKVYIEIYCSSLNEQCKSFLSGSFKDAIRVKGIYDLADIRIIPFGNGNIDKYGRDYDFNCQNGVKECIGNILYQCALTNYFETASFPFIACLAGSQGNWVEDANRCAAQNKIAWDRLKDCSNSFEGRERLFFAGMMAKYIRPKALPAIYVNGEDDSHRRQMVISNMLQVICELYTGTIKLHECDTYTSNRSIILASAPKHMAKSDSEEEVIEPDEGN